MYERPGGWVVVVPSRRGALASVLDREGHEKRVMFTAVEGEYLIEVHGYASSEYTLDIATSGDGGGSGGQAMTAARTVGGLASVASKLLPAHPLVATTPGQAETPDAGPQQHVYLPLVLCHP